MISKAQKTLWSKDYCLLRRDRRPDEPADRHGRLGLGAQYAVSLLQAGGLAAGRGAQRLVVCMAGTVEAAGVRSQFVDVTDVTPTISSRREWCTRSPGRRSPAEPFDGVSFAYSFTQPQAPSRHRTQYFEVFGNAAIYHDGWFLAEAVKVDPRVDAAMADPKAALAAL